MQESGSAAIGIEAWKRRFAMPRSTTFLTCLAIMTAGFVLGAGRDSQTGTGRDPHRQEYRYSPKYGQTYHLPPIGDEFATVFTRTVSYRDLDLTSTEGRETLYRRARHAIEHACVYDGPMLSIGTQDASCRYRAWKKVRPQLEALVRRTSGSPIQ